MFAHLCICLRHYSSFINIHLEMLTDQVVMSDRAGNMEEFFL